MNRINYPTAAALIAAFNAGVKFFVRSRDGEVSPVILIKESEFKRGGFVVKTRGGLGSGWIGFDLQGANAISSDVSLLEASPAVSSPRVSEATPFLQAFVTGKPAYCQKTREIVQEVAFQSGMLRVILLDPKTGKNRCSFNYRHDGSHKHDPARNLVTGVPPKPKKQIKVAIYRAGFTGSLFCLRVGEVLPNLKGYRDAPKVGEGVIEE